MQFLEQITGVNFEFVDLDFSLSRGVDVDFSVPRSLLIHTMTIFLGLIHLIVIERIFFKYIWTFLDYPAFQTTGLQLLYSIWMSILIRCWRSMFGWFLTFSFLEFIVEYTLHMSNMPMYRSAISIIYCGALKKSNLPGCYLHIKSLPVQSFPISCCQDSRACGFEMSDVSICCLHFFLLLGLPDPQFLYYLRY